MTIVVDEIPQAGLVIEGELPPAWVGESALPPYSPGSPVALTLQVRRHVDTVQVTGEVRLALDFECSRTLAPGRLDLALPIQALFQPSGRHDISLGEGIEAEAFDEDGLSTYEGPTLDLEPLVREEIVMAQDPYPVVVPAAVDVTGPLWSSTDPIEDPRWDKLKSLKPKG